MIDSLARLEKTPTEIVVEERARLELELSTRVSRQNSWLWAYARWRLEAVRKLAGVYYGAPAYAIWSFVFRALQLAAAILIFLPDARVASILAVVLLTGVGLTTHGTKFFDERWRKHEPSTLKGHVWRTLCLPLMPLMRLGDIVVTLLPRRLTEDQTERIQDTSYKLVCLEASTFVPAYYLRGIDDDRKELLGDNSVLRTAERELRANLENICGDIKRLEARLATTAGNADRVSILKPELNEQRELEAKCATALADVEQAIVAATAILDECAANINNLRQPLKDAALVEETSRNRANTKEALDRVEDALARNRGRICARLSELAAAVSAPPRELPAANSADDSLAAYLDRVDRMTDRVFALRTSAASPQLPQ